MNKTINVIKIGGNVIDDPVALNAFLTDFAAIERPKVLVHGGGREATRLSARLGIQNKMIDGRRVTDDETLEVVTMIYAGLLNKRIVAALQARGCKAVGLSGADGDLIPATRRPAEPIDYGNVGDIDANLVSDRFLEVLFSAGYTPVVCAICHDRHGNLLNCNADSVAAALAVGASRLGRVRLTYCFEQPGVMTDLTDEASLVPLVTPAIFDELRSSGKVSGGMLPKLSNALQCAADGVGEVRICRAADLCGLGGTIVRQA
ncbi:MAG: acetylglutamate kinase [Muribaculaceae bacterium]|nr:acetylglutamate kinase [Muribaculaceae bacterium]